MIIAQIYNKLKNYNNYKYISIEYNKNKAYNGIKLIKIFMYQLYFFKIFIDYAGKIRYNIYC